MSELPTIFNSASASSGGAASLLGFGFWANELLAIAADGRGRASKCFKSGPLTLLREVFFEAKESVGGSVEEQTCLGRVAAQRPVLQRTAAAVADGSG